MKKISSLIAILLLCAVTLFAQAPEKFTYQAVVRNTNNNLVANSQVGVRVSILQGSASGSAVYVETQTGTTNANGLVTLSIGGGSVQQGTF
ncbi:MAG: Vir protein, partial [Bacteroidales bacterium]|nr:Vir protein [Bacteroidales bacterium]